MEVFLHFVYKKIKFCVQKGCIFWKFRYNKDMPYLFTHLSFGWELLHRHPLWNERTESMFALGCLGPDIFFFDRLPPTPFVPHRKKHGNALHGVDSADLLTALLRHATEETLPYVLGFCTHIALDGTLHPYVEARHRGIDHTRFEGVIDSLVYAERKDTVPFLRMLRRCPDTDAVDALIAAAAQDTLGVGYPNAYRRSAKKFYRLLPFLFDPNGKRCRFLLRAERMLKREGLLSAFLLAAPRADDEDCQNLAHRSWAAPWSQEIHRTESVPELMETAKCLANTLLSCISKKEYAIIAKSVKNHTMQKGSL